LLLVAVEELTLGIKAETVKELVPAVQVEELTEVTAQALDKMVTLVVEALNLQVETPLLEELVLGKVVDLDLEALVFVSLRLTHQVLVVVVVGMAVGLVPHKTNLLLEEALGTLVELLLVQPLMEQELQEP
jgi:hypothetical protein